MRTEEEEKEEEQGRWERDKSVEERVPKGASLAHDIQEPLHRITRYSRCTTLHSLTHSLTQTLSTSSASIQGTEEP